MTKPFIPSSQDLNNMIARAMGKFEADRAQAALKREAQACAHLEKSMIAAAEQRRRRMLWGV